MARAIWSGSISFGLVNIPIKLATAVSRKNVSFNQLDRRTGARIKQKRVSAADGVEVPYEEIVKGYELSGGEYVTVSEEELAALDPDATRTIDILEFVDLADIDPIFYDTAYHVVPDRLSAKPYKLLAEAMERSQKVGIARFVMRTKQYLAAVRPKDGKLLLSTMVYADELVAPEQVDGYEGLAKVDLSEREVDMAVQLIESLSEEFDPVKFEDTYRQQVMELIERKAAGETEIVLAPAEPIADKVVDLMAALEASVREAKAARKRHPSGGAPDLAEVTPAKKPAKRAAKAALADAAEAEASPKARRRKSA